jgi:hypothetical protein
MGPPQNDLKFIFSYNFNDINQLVFSRNSEIGSLFITSALAINPSIKSSSTQNVINMKYTNITIEENISCTINQISIARNILTENPTSFSIVLHGNVLTSPGTNLYIIIPFEVQSSNNKTPNSVAVEQIVKMASIQLRDNKSQTIMDEPISLNNLIENNTLYKYCVKPIYNTPQLNNTIIIYKENVAVISGLYIKFLTIFNAGDANNHVLDTSEMFQNKFTPEVQKETSTNEIMIDCSPVQITTKEKNVMFSKKDGIYGSTSTSKNETIVASFFLIIFSFLTFYLLYKIFKIWSGYFFKDTDISNTMQVKG